MKKIAIFVEGQTEQIFVNRLVKEILGDNISIIQKRSIGGTNIPKQELIRHISIAKNPEYHVFINDCGADNRVKSEILDNIESLFRNDFKYFIGLRDLYPLSEEELPKLKKGLSFLPSNYYRYKSVLGFVIVVQEVETWFLGETRHLSKVDKRLKNGAFINKYLGFNPYSSNVLQRRHPSQDLNNIYQLVGKSYTKRYWQVEKLVNRLDFDNILRNLRYDIFSLGQLIDSIEKIKKL